ncbi:Uncharacterised protein [Enterobacter hormaechei]|nr:Uncharacterised protein [Enterobacter hormaechei]
MKLAVYSTKQYDKKYLHMLTRRTVSILNFSTFC